MRPALDHRPGALPVEPGRAERFGLAVHRAEEGTVAVFADPGGLDVLPQPVFQIVLAGHLMALATFLV